MRCPRIGRSMGSSMILLSWIILLGVSSDLVLGADDFYFTRIGDGESITSRGRKTVVDQERRVTLECAVSDARQIGFRWSMNGISLHNSSRRYQIGSNLYFSRIERDEDAGEYSCVATNFSSGHSKTSAPMSMSVIWISPTTSVVLSSPERASDIRPGVDVVLKCRIEATTSDITYEWFRNGDPVERSERVASRGRKLHLNSVTGMENGCYTCSAKNDIAGISTPVGKFPLIVKDEKIPKILLVPEDQIAKKNESIRFDCVFEQTTFLQWFFYDSEPLSNSSRYIIHPNGSLTITHVEERDEGVYKCLGNSLSFPEEEPQIYSCSLRLAYLQQLSSNYSFDPPPLISNNKLAVPENGFLQINCDEPAGLPTPRTWWEGPDGKVVLSETSTFSQSSNTLTLRNVNLNATGNLYTCVAENLEGITRASFELIVTPPPTIFGHPSATTATEGETTFFVCQFRGAEYPVSHIRWMKNRILIHHVPAATPGRRNLGHHQNPIALGVSSPHEEAQFSQRAFLFPENGTLKIESVQLNDAGDYTCEVITDGHPPVESRPAQLFVTEMLKFTPKPIDRKLELGTNSKLHCRAKGSTPPVIKWVKEGQPLFQWPSHVLDQNGTLHFLEVKATDRGVYTCVATSSTQGIINSTIYVDVIVSPKFSVLPKNPTEVTEGQSFTIHCAAFGDPSPTISYDHRPSNNLINGFDRNRFRVMENGSLLVTEVMKEDDGFMGCTAGNSGGFRREEVRLIVVKSNDHYYSSESLDDTVMTRTISITLSVAAGYMLLVVGLMMWCRYRQLRRKQAYLAEVRKETGDAEMKDNVNNSICNVNGNGPHHLLPNGHVVKTESCRESVKSDGETAKSSHSSTVGGGTKTASVTASITSHKSAYSQSSKRSAASSTWAQLEKISFPREDLQFVMLLGHGEFGEVFLAKGKSFREDGTEAEGEALVMVKALQTRDETALFNFKREIDLYYKLNHENVSKLVRLCRENDPHYMIMDYSDWGDLKQFLLATRQDCIRPLPAPKPPPLTVSQILQVISQVALGMEHLSNHRFIHKDLATRNCLISSGLRIKIGNPSLCKDTYSAEYFTVRNHTTSIRWLPAEAVLEDDFSTKSDVWSFAVSVWETIHQAAMPFSTKTNDQVVAALERKELRWTTADMENKVPAGLHKLLTQCWDASPKNRPNFSAIVIQLSEIIKDELNFSSGRK